jgi:hypothetical protein
MPEDTLVFRYFKAVEAMLLATEDLLFCVPEEGDDFEKAAKDAWHEVTSIKHDLDQAATYGLVARAANADVMMNRMGWQSYRTPGGVLKPKD